MFALSRPTGGFALIFVLGGTGGVLLFDVLGTAALIQLARQASFPQADGVVTKRVVYRYPRGSGCSGSSCYSPMIEYEYVVNGRRYAGRRGRSEDFSADANDWMGAAKNLSAGAAVRVSYNPNNPAESALRPELTGLDLSRIWLLTAFNALVFGGWRVLLVPRWFRPTGPRVLRRTENGWLVRLPGLWPADRFAIALFVLCACGSLAWEFGFGGIAPMPLAAWLYLGAVVSAVWVAGRHARILGVDEKDRVVRLACGSRVVAVPFDAVRDVIVRPRGAYRCELLRSDTATAEPLSLASFQHEADAIVLAEWLRERVGLAPAGDATT